MEIFVILLLIIAPIIFIANIIIDIKGEKGISEYNEKSLRADAKILRIERIYALNLNTEIRMQVLFSDGFIFTTTKTKIRSFGFHHYLYVDDEMRAEIAKMATVAHEKALRRHGMIK